MIRLPEPSYPTLQNLYLPPPPSKRKESIIQKQTSQPRSPVGSQPLTEPAGHRPPQAALSPNTIAMQSIVFPLSLPAPKTRYCICTPARISAIPFLPNPHSLSLALPVGPVSSSSSITTSSPAMMANSAFCNTPRSAVFLGSTNSAAFSFALLRILPPQVARFVSSRSTHCFAQANNPSGSFFFGCFWWKGGGGVKTQTSDPHQHLAATRRARTRPPTPILRAR